MSFGFIALGAIAIGTAVYSADKQRKAQHEAMDAQKKADEDDARQAAELDTSTALAANAKFAADKRLRQQNVLALGGAGSALGGGPAAGGGGPGGAPTAPGGSPVTSSVLGSGAPGASVGGAAGSVGSLRSAGNPGGGRISVPRNVNPY